MNFLTKSRTKSLLESYSWWISGSCFWYRTSNGRKISATNDTNCSFGNVSVSLKVANMRTSFLDRSSDFVLSSWENFFRVVGAHVPRDLPRIEVPRSLPFVPDSVWKNDRCRYPSPPRHSPLLVQHQSCCALCATGRVQCWRVSRFFLSTGVCSQGAKLSYWRFGRHGQGQ